MGGYTYYWSVQSDFHHFQGIAIASFFQHSGVVFHMTDLGGGVCRRFTAATSDHCTVHENLYLCRTLASAKQNSKNDQGNISHLTGDAGGCLMAGLNAEQDLQHSLEHRTQTVLRRDKEQYIRNPAEEAGIDHFLVNDIR